MLNTHKALPRASYKKQLSLTDIVLSKVIFGRFLGLRVHLLNYDRLNSCGSLSKFLKLGISPIIYAYIYIERERERERERNEHTRTPHIYTYGVGITLVRPNCFPIIFGRGCFQGICRIRDLQVINHI